MGITEPTSLNWNNLSKILKGFLGAAKVTENLDYNRYFPIFHNAETLLTKLVATPKPSVFKQSSAFLLSFIAESPLRHQLPPGSLDAKILAIANHQNAVVAFEYVRHMLTGAVINHSERGELVLTNKIKVSKHYYCDLIHAFANYGKAEHHPFHSTALLIESLVYKSNPNISDTENV